MFIPAVKEAESRLKCTSDVNYRESIADNNSLPLLSDRPQHFLQTGHPHFRRLCHLCSGAQAGAAGGHQIMASNCPPAAIGDGQKAFGQPLYPLMKPSFRKTAKGI